MSEMHEPSAGDLIARHFAGRFVRHDEGMWFDLQIAREVVEFCASQWIAVVRLDDEWDWPEGRQCGSYDNRMVLQRSLTWREVVKTCAERAGMYLEAWRWRPEERGFAVSFTFYTEAAWQEHYA
jgi:hypothetical protein